MSGQVVYAYVIRAQVTRLSLFIIALVEIFNTSKYQKER